MYLPAALLVAGVGTGLFTTPFFAVALSGVGPQETGSAAGLLNAVQQLGGTLGVAVVGGVYLAGAGGGGGAAHALTGTGSAGAAARAALLTAGLILAATALAAAAMTSASRRGAVAPVPDQPRR